MIFFLKNFVMDSWPDILDISSDDESSLGGVSEGFDWISELFDGVDDNDSDDVVVVREVNNTKRKSKSLESTARDADDDCVVLDGDPDNPVSVENEVSSGSDELLVVGEKGQIACRDYPHPRHLCVKHPFSSTPHDRHCDQCHCYVCESLAPCLHWSTGIFSKDHCHATDKEEFWKIQRKNFRPEKNAPPALKAPDTCRLMALPQLQEAQPLDIHRLAPNSMPQNQVSGPAGICCPTLPNFTLPNIISHRRSQQSASVLAKNRIHPRLVPQNLLGVRNNVTQKDRVLTVGTLGPEFVSSHAKFKRAGTVSGALPMHPSVYGSSNKVNYAHAAQSMRNATPTASSNDRNLVRWQNVHPSVNLESYRPQNSSQPNLDSFVATAVPSQQPIYSQPIAQSNDGENSCQNGYQSQNANEGIYPNGNQSLNASQNICEQGNQSQSAMGPGFSDFNFAWPCHSGQSNQKPSFENSQVQSGGSICERYPVAVEEFNSEFIGNSQLSQSNQRPEFSGSTNLSQSNQEPPIENFQLESTGSIYEPTPVKVTSCQFPGSINLSPLEDLDNWFLENQSVPDGSMPTELNIFSPQTSSIDAGMLLFDFETSWNGLAHA